MSTTAAEPKSRKGIGGPKTPEGKERIRLNALKMGLNANSLAGMQAVSDVMEVSFEEIHQKMLDYYKPADPIEEALVRRIARCSWKLQLIETIEDQALDRLQLQSAPGGSLESLSVIERRTDVQLHRAISALTAKRREEQEKVKNKLTESAVEKAVTRYMSRISPHPAAPSPAHAPTHDPNHGPSGFSASQSREVCHGPTVW